MSTDRNQSAIREVRDQLSLDRADGDRLNIVSGNLGMDRPVFGFSDDSWRSLVKAIALQYKQVRNRFRAVLDILFGPQYTQVSGLTTAVAIADRTFVLNDTTGMPQLGTMVFDEGLATEETLDYCFIERDTNTVFLTETAGFGFAHTAVDQDAEQPIIAVNENTGTTIVLPSTRGFPTTGLPYVVVLGRTEDDVTDEIAVEVTAVDQVRGTLTLGSALASTPTQMSPTVTQTLLSLPYAVGATFIVLDNSLPFPETGYVFIDYKTDEFTAAGTHSTTTVEAATGTFPANIHNTMYIKFTGNITGALTDVEAAITSNTTTTITFSTVGTAPVNDDTFRILQPPFNATAGDPTFVTVNGGTFTVGRQVGNQVEFEGNVTPTLAGISTNIVENTDAILTFGNTLANAPVSGDRFRIRPRAEYTSNASEDGALNLHLPVFDMVFPAGARVELLQAGFTAAVGQAQVKGCRWDLFEVTPRQLDIYLPEKLLDIGDLRSASYLHTAYTNEPSSTLASGASAGDTFISVTSTADLPIVGVVALDPGGTNERVGYYKNNLLSTGSITNTGATIVDAETFTLDDGINTAVVFEFDDDDSVIQTDILRKVDISAVVTDEDSRDAMVSAINTAPALDITATADPLSTSVLLLENDNEGTLGNVTTTETVTDALFVVAGMSGGDTRLSLATQTLANAFIATDVVALYEPRYGATSLLDGDYAGTADTFPGPYVYDLSDPAPTGTVALTTIDTQLIPGPTTVEIDQVNTHTALEVKNATAFDLVNFPYSIIVGKDTGNNETVVVTDVNLKDRTTTTALTAVTQLVGQTFIRVTDLTPGAATDAQHFPNALGYRVRIDNGETVYVMGTTTTPDDRLLLQSGLEIQLDGDEVLTLVADVLSVNALADFHEGRVAYADRAGDNNTTAEWPETTTLDITSSEIVEPLISSFDILSATGLDITEGRVILNFGAEQLPQEDELVSGISAAATAIPLVFSDNFPTTYPYVITIDPGHLLLEERHVVSNNVIGTDTLTIDVGVLKAHSAGAKVTWEPGPQETVEYDSIATNTLSFSPAIVLQSTHSPVESVIASSVDSVPRTDGFDFPFRLPPDIRERVKTLLDLIRAAGVQVIFIEKR